MCGIAGFFKPTSFNKTESITILKGMCDAIAHRGPDGEGYWFNDSGIVALGHRRLSIIDHSPSGAQPMHSNSGRFTIVFNGEIYNHLDIRKSLEQINSAQKWHGHSDTETLLASFDTFGIEETLQRATGMFAFAVWDRKQNSLTLARDRLGEKPLYYGWQGNGNNAAFLFGSDIAALKIHPEFVTKINLNALGHFMRYNCTGAEESIFTGIKKLRPGHILELTSKSMSPVIKQYWSIEDVAKQGTNNPFDGSTEEAISELNKLLNQSIRQQMVADVPVGAFLSGGIDSSLIVALMKEHSKQPVKTFSIGFHENGYDEAVYAKAIAKHLGTDHTEFYMSYQNALDLIPQLPQLFTEPFADSSQIPTYLVSKLARKYVTVALSGDAGDELFCGYNRYKFAANTWKKMQYISLQLRKISAKAIRAIPQDTWNRIAAFLPHAHVGEKFHKAARAMESSSIDELYQTITSHWKKPSEVIIGYNGNVAHNNNEKLQNISAVEQMMLLDQLTYLTNDILTKVDRSAMATSLETRIPFLDQKVIEFAWSLPMSMKLNNNITKWPLRQILYQHVPQQLINRPKMGFSIPIAIWLRGPLRDWAENLLDETTIKNDGYFNSSLIRKKLEEHLAGTHNWQEHLWNVLMFQSWLKVQNI